MKKQGGLVLTLKIGDTLYIGDDIQVKIVDKHGRKRVVVQTIAPNNIKILHTGNVNKEKSNE